MANYGYIRYVIGWSEGCFGGTDWARLLLLGFHYIVAAS